MTSPQAVILMYHRIDRVELDPWGMCVTPENFSGHLEAIKRVAQPMSLLDFVQAREAGELPERSVVITFDDGYVDNFQQALPLLQRHHVPATFFISTGNIDSGAEFWWDRLESILLGPDTLAGQLELPLPSGTVAMTLGEGARYEAAERAADRGVYPWTAAPGSRLRFFYEVWKNLWPLAETVREDALQHLGHWAGVDSLPSASRRTMTSAELRSMAAEPLAEIGAHTVSHPPLSNRDVAEQAGQILDCRDRLQQILGVRVASFAYPHGKYLPETVRILEDSGFRCAVTTEHRLADADSEPMKLPRFGAKDVAGDAFLLQLRQWFGIAEPTMDHA